MLRTFFVLILIVVTAIVTLPYLLIELLVGLFSMRARDAMTLFIMRLEFRLLAWASGARTHITGLENIPRDEPVLYIGNHRSFYDIVITYYLFPNMTSMVSKKEWERIPFLAWWMKLLHNLFLDRSDLKQGMKTILAAIELVKGGMSVCIYPEGTRNKTEEPMLPFHEGSFKIAEKSGCKIIPMTMYNMSALLEDHFPKIKASDVYVDFGKPIDVSTLEKEERKHIGAYTRTLMLKRYEELQRKAAEQGV